MLLAQMILDLLLSTSQLRLAFLLNAFYDTLLLSQACLELVAFVLHSLKQVLQLSQLLLLLADVRLAQLLFF